MTDLEITRLCAEAMGGTLCLTPDNVMRFSPKNTHPLMNGFALFVYNPLHDDAQAMALVKKFLLTFHYDKGEWWVRYLADDEHGHYLSSGSKDLNRAICECVAKMQAAK